VKGAERGAVHDNEASTLQDTVDDRLGQIGIMQHLAEAAVATGAGEVVDEGGGGGEEGLEAVLDGAIGHGDGQVRLPSAASAGTLNDN